MGVEDIEKRVVHAGGNVEGLIVISLSWSTADDLDLHVKTPGGSEINYRNRKAGGGELDVDMCVHGRHSGKCTERPVENIVFADEAPEGRFEIYVQNWGYHDNVRTTAVQVADVLEGRKASKNKHQQEILKMGTNRPVLFEVLLKVDGVPRLFSGLCTHPGKTHESSNVQIFAFDFYPFPSNGEKVLPVFEAPDTDPVCAMFKEKVLLADGGSSGRPQLEGRGDHRSAVPGRGNTARKSAGSSKKEKSNEFAGAG